MRGDATPNEVGIRDSRERVAVIDKAPADGEVVRAMVAAVLTGPSDG